jgi:hypothetical protein
MKIFSALAKAALPLLALVPAAFCCDKIPTGQTIWIRLSSPVSSYTAKPGDVVQGVLTEAITCDGDTEFPLGTHVSGVVHSVHKVGWGVVHETATLNIQFNHLQGENGQPVTFSGQVAEVENAREQVTAKGTIQGIRSSDTPEGRINSRLRHLPTFNPYSDLGLIVYKATFPIFPEPEIYLPTGTDLRVKLEAPMAAQPDVPQPVVDTAAYDADDFELQEVSRTLPVRTETVNQSDADLINLVFVGSRQQVQTAFHDAGWVNSDVFTRHSFMRNFYAFLNNSGYPQEPMRPFYLNGNPADMQWQKSLNSYARRDHLRMWEWTDSATGQTMWLSASTHDTGAALSLKYHQFVHHISPDIDDERSKVIRDLNAAGCVQSVHVVQRPRVPTMTQSYNGDPIRTDGSVAFVELKNCQSTTPELAEISTPAPYKPGNMAFRYFRRQILNFRSDIWRANIIYGVYDLGRMSFTALKHHNEMETAQHNNNKVTQPAGTVQASVQNAATTGATPLPGSH